MLIFIMMMKLRIMMIMMIIRMMMVMMTVVEPLLAKMLLPLSAPGRTAPVYLHNAYNDRTIMMTMMTLMTIVVMGPMIISGMMVMILN